MKLTPIDQLSATIKEKRTPVLLYGRDEWLNGRFFTGFWEEHASFPGIDGEWVDSLDERGRGDRDDVTHFALLPAEPEVTAEQRAAFDALRQAQREDAQKREAEHKARQDAYNADPNNFPASLDEKDKWEWQKMPSKSRA